ncbi:MAG: thioredoxin family protein [Planctomycetaceae bacterium]
MTFRNPLLFVFLLVLRPLSADSPEIGDVAPDWNLLPGTDGKQHSLKDLKDAEAIVVCFTSNTCPYSIDYEDRLMALQKKYTDDGANVPVVAINANGIPADDLEQMIERATSKNFNFLYLKDASQEVARAYGAIYTPEFYVLNRQKQIVYRGAMDDATKEADVKIRYVERAVTAAREGGVPDVQKTGARGCAIRFKRQRR